MALGVRQDGGTSERLNELARRSERRRGEMHAYKCWAFSPSRSSSLTFSSFVVRGVKNGIPVKRDDPPGVHHAFVGKPRRQRQMQTTNSENVKVTWSGLPTSFHQVALEGTKLAKEV